MITELTKKQQELIKETRNDGLRIGRDVSPVDRKTTEKVFREFYKILNKKTPIFWYCQSPLSATIIINLLNTRQNIRKNIWKNIWQNIKQNIRQNIWENIRQNIWQNIRQNIWKNIGQNIEENIEQNIGKNIRKNIRENIGQNIGKNIRQNIRQNIGQNIWQNIEKNIGENIWENIWQNIGENIGQNIWKNIGQNTRQNIEKNIGENIWENIEWVDFFCQGQHDINWTKYYLYYRDSGLLENDDNFKIMDLWHDLAKSAGWCYTFENIVFVCEKPCEVNINETGKLHKDGGMALRYSDGWGLYMLNGVQVPEWLAETRDTDIDPEKVLAIENAEVRREFVRKVGVDRIVKKFGSRKLDTKDFPLYSGEMVPMYELLVFDPPSNIGGKDFKYLKMINPSLSTKENYVYHLEGVGPDCETVHEALMWRNGDGYVYDDLEGVDWLIHGDVIVIPENAKILKLWPKAVA